MTTATTPADLSITSRNLSVDRNAVNPRWWHGGDPVPTAFFNALSATFPQGETFFIEAVRRFRDQADPKLKEQIATFIQQEAMHTREHVAFNRLIKSSGYDTRRWMPIRAIASISPAHAIRSRNWRSPSRSSTSRPSWRTHCWRIRSPCPAHRATS